MRAERLEGMAQPPAQTVRQELQLFLPPARLVWSGAGRSPLGFFSQGFSFGAVYHQTYAGAVDAFYQLHKNVLTRLDLPKVKAVSLRVGQTDGVAVDSVLRGH